MDGQIRFGKKTPQRLAVVRRRAANGRAKHGTKGAKAGITDGQANIGNWALLASQQAFRVVNALARQEVVRRLPKCPNEHAVVMKWGKACMFCGFIEGHSPIQGDRQIVSGAAKANESFLFDERQA